MLFAKRSVLAAVACVLLAVDGASASNIGSPIARSPTAAAGTVGSIPRGGWKLFGKGKSSVKSKVDEIVHPNPESNAVNALPSKKLSVKAAVTLGIVLAFNSGFVNGICLSGLASADKSKQAVAAVTASYTNGAIGLASGNTGTFSWLTQVILSFMSGSAIASLLNPCPVPFEISQTPFAACFVIAAILLFMAAGRLNDSMSTVRSGMLLAAMANGIQNSITSTFTSNMCRTSHFSGITSDIGTFIGQVVRGNRANMLKLQVFLGLALSFWLGGFASWGAAKSYGSMSLYFSSVLYILIATSYDYLARKTLS